MALDPLIRRKLVLPAVCAPMFLVSGPDLVREACAAGLMAGLPRSNARTPAMFASWLADIRRDLDESEERHPDRPVGPLAVNLAVKMDTEEIEAELTLCERYGVDIIISVGGNPAEMTKRVHDHGIRIFHDVTSLRFAEKAAAAGVDGLTCIGSGGGGKSGTLGHLVLVPKVREVFDGTIICAGTISTGAAIRAAEILGADLAYMGTRFIATQESLAPDGYKQMIVDGTSLSLRWTPDVVGVPGNWLADSIRQVGLDPDNLTPARGVGDVDLPEGAIPWKTIWSAGQGLDLIEDIPTVRELVDRLCAEYVRACEIPDMTAAARIVDRVLDSDPLRAN
jgi:nitronate monooxygenase